MSAGQQGAVGVVAAAGRDRKAAVEVFAKLGQIGIGGFHVGDAPQAQFLDQPVLQGLVGPFDASFGLRRVGTEDLDVQFLHGPPELGQPAGCSQGPRLIDPKDAVFVAVEGHRLAVALEIMPRGFAIGKKGLVRAQTTAPPAARWHHR